MKRGSRPEGEDRLINNYIDGVEKPSVTGRYLDVESPSTAGTCGRVTISDASDVDEAVAAAKAAFPAWSALTVKRRAAYMFKFHALMEANADELADLITMENGKNRTEALAEVAKGNETVEWACSLPQVCQGNFLEVSRGITCREHRDPIGVVASICPFNFPVMVPMWTVPIALTAGNCVILKPSEKVPNSANRLAQLFSEAGLPKGVFQVVHGQVDVVNAICDHPDVQVVSFVGSSRVAEIVAKRCRALNKRVIALGGAKNHLVALPDCDKAMATQDIVASFSGCCGQRCMAASVLLLVGEQPELLKMICDRAGSLTLGTEAGQVGAVIDGASKARIIKYIDDAEAGGAKILLDGRKQATKSPGYWVGPTVILHSNKDDAAMQDEIFGPVISVYVVDTWHEAIEIENSNPFGNAASVYTSVGGHAEWFLSRFRAGMLGVNIGVPVPREPFSFGGRYGTLSKFGDMDITGDGCLELFTHRKKVTAKWPILASAAVGSPSAGAGGAGAGGAGAGAGASAAASASAADGADKASFVGNM